MYVVLLVLGILVTGAGLVAIGFGIRFNELDVGATLILAGSSVLSGGLVLVGLGLAVRELSRILDAVKPRAGVRSARPAEAIEPVMPTPVVNPPAAAPRAAPAKAPAAAPKVEAPRVEPQIQVARQDATLDVSASAIERLRSSLPRPERVVPETEGVPLSPNGGGQHAPEPMPEPQPAPQPIAVEPPPAPARPVEAPVRAAATAETVREKEPRLDFLFRSKPRAAASESFDAVWPRRSRSAEAARAPAEPAQDARAAAPAAAAATGEDSRALAILKSGVVDGMAYTLYADGSIEAQLPHGTVRFGSIAELRAHIENNS